MKISCVDLGGIKCSYGETQKGLIYLVNKKDSLTDGELERFFKDCKANKFFDFSSPKDRTGKKIYEVAKARKPVIIKDPDGYCVIQLLLLNGVPPYAIISHMPRYISKHLDEWMGEDVNLRMRLRGQELSHEDITFIENCLGRQEKSCGAVIFDGNKVLIEHMVQKHTSLPKGHVEQIDESAFKTAYREVNEETGLEIKQHGHNSYKIYYSPYEGIAKMVVFFLATVVGGKEKVQLAEVDSIEWVEIDRAIEMVTYDTDKRVLKWAKSVLKL